MLSFWKDFHMTEAFALPRFFINYKLKLILISNLIFGIIVFNLLQSIKHNKAMFAFKQELEHKIQKNLEEYKKEDEEIEKKHKIILEKLQDPRA